MKLSELENWQKGLIVVGAIVVVYIVFVLVNGFLEVHVREPTHLGTVDWNDVGSFLG